MIDIPDPPVPPEADMRGLSFMPLDVARLLDSDLFALSTGDEFKAAVALWCKCWTQMPASSLPDDDRVLAHLSGAGPRWKKIKDMALRGFVRCSDGRLYHMLIADKVKEAWAMRVRQRERSVRGNQKRWGSNEDGGNNPVGDPHGDAHGDPNGHPTSDPPRDPKGQGQCKGQVDNSDSTISDLLPVGEQRAAEKSKKNQYPEAFLALWAAYPTDANMSKKEAFDVWKRLPEAERQEAIKSLPAFRAYCQQNPDYRPVHLCRYLSKRRAEGFLESAEKLAAAANVFVKSGTPEWAAWREFYRETKGKDPPVNKDGGWYFGSQWPPRQPEMVH